MKPQDDILRDFVNQASKNIAEGLVLRTDQRIAVVIKPRPKLIPNNIWLRLASLFIYIERTNPSMTLATQIERIK